MHEIEKEILPMLDGLTVYKTTGTERSKIARLTQGEDGVVVVHRLPACSVGDYYSLLTTLSQKGYRYK